MKYDKKTGYVTQLPKVPLAVTIKIFSIGYDKKISTSQFPDISSFTNWVEV